MLIQRQLSLHEYIALATTLVPGPECDIDITFFKINCTGNRDELKQIISRYTGSYSLNLFDGKVHNFIEIGNWLTNEQTGLRLMALGAHLDLWRLITTRDIAPDLDANAVITWAKTGMIAIVVEPDA